MSTPQPPQPPSTPRTPGPYARGLRRTMNAGMAAAVGGAMLTGALTAERTPPTGGWVSPTGQPTAEVHNARLAGPHNTPAWTPRLSRQFPGFTDAGKIPEGHIPKHMVVVDQRNQTHVMPFQQAWDRSHDTEKPEVWVVGASKR